MKRFISAAATALLLLAPMGSLADFSSPSEIFSAVYGRPKGFSGEMHGHWNTYWASLWISGTSMGTSASNITAAVNGTLDVAMMGGKTRVKFQVKMVDKVLYLYIDSLDGSYQDKLLQSAWGIKTKTWIKIEMPADTEVFANDFSPLDNYLKIESATTGNGKTYNITFTRDGVRNILSQLRSADHTDWAEGLSAVPRTAALHIAVTMNGDEKFVAATAKADLASNMFSLNANMKSWAVNDVSVTAPKDSLTIEEWGTTFMNSMSGGESSSSAWDSSSSSSEDSVIDISCDPNLPSDMTCEDFYSPTNGWKNVKPVFGTDDCRLDMDAIRHGECPEFVPTSRRLP